MPGYWNIQDDDFLAELRKILPPIFTREIASKMIGGIFSSRTLSNFDAAGNGPANKRRIGKKVVYRKEEFLMWLGRMMGCKHQRINKLSRGYY